MFQHGTCHVRDTLTLDIDFLTDDGFQCIEPSLTSDEGLEGIGVLRRGSQRVSLCPRRVFGKLIPVCRFTAALAHPDQISFNGPAIGHDSIASIAPEASYWVPRIDRSAYLDLDNADSGPGDGGDENSLPEMSLHALHISGPSSSRVDLTFFSDGCEYISLSIITRFV